MISIHIKLYENTMNEYNFDKTTIKQIHSTGAQNK